MDANKTEQLTTVVTVIYPGKAIIKKIDLPFYCKTNIKTEGDGLIIIDKRGKFEISLETGGYTVAINGIEINNFNLDNELTKEQAQQLLKKAIGDNWNHEHLFN